MTQNRRLIRDSSAYEGPSENAGIVANVPAGTVLSVLPADVWSTDEEFFKALLGRRQVYFLAADAVKSDDQVSGFVPPDPPEPPAAGFDVWKLYAEEVGGTYSTPPARRLGPFKLYSHLHTVNTAVENWVIVLEYVVTSGENSSNWTRMSAPYTERHPLTFHIYRRSVLSDLGKRLFNQQDIEIGQADFDREFVIKSSDEASVRRLLGTGSLRALLRDRDDIYLKAEGATLIFKAGGIIEDIHLLKALHSLFVETLKELQRLGFIR